MSQKQLNVIALISGGKDSLFSLLHCLHNGHRVIALANLHPVVPASGPPSEEQDINSYMYQTVGHSVIPLYAEALELPLYRQAISGTAVVTSKDYGPENDAHDETEDLIPLLRKIKQEYPEANAVSAGAILSTYQRTRIESVALRLGLVPLAYLWQYPFLPPPTCRGSSLTGLLDDMETAGCEARIVKIATGGLDEGLLWGNVCDSTTRSRILRGMRRYHLDGDGTLAGAVLGEGGEYETLALDGPDWLWCKRIEVDGWEVVQEDGGTALVQLKGARCAEKNQREREERKLISPTLLDTVFADLATKQLTHFPPTNNVISRRVTSRPGNLDAQPPQIKQCTSTSSNTLFVSNLSVPHAGSVTDQMAAICNCLLQEIKSHGASAEAIVFTTILLRSMSDFASVNAIYGRLFAKPNPPARVTISCGEGLPSDVDVILSVVVDLGPQNSRKGLHVQSRSYWAPANIGPYSQAISTPVPSSSTSSLVYVAGQIPLVPASMELLSVTEHQEPIVRDYFRSQAILSLQHLWRIGIVTNVDCWSGGIAFLFRTDSVAEKATIAWEVWEKVHKKDVATEKEDDDSDLDAPDAWDRKYGLHQSFTSNMAIELKTLPNFDIVKHDAPASPVPPFLAVEVESLPRDSAIEWQSLGLNSVDSQIHMDGSISNRTSIQSTHLSGITFSTVSFLSSSQTTPADFITQLRSSILSLPGNAVHVTAYVPQNADFQPLPLLPILTEFAAQVVPCYSLWGPDGQELDMALVVRTESTDPLP